MLCLRNISVDILHKGDTENDDIIIIIIIVILIHLSVYGVLIHVSV
jgi:hypothetical protein